MIDEELADQWDEAGLIQEAMYSGYVKAHGIKVLPKWDNWVPLWQS
jgi:hypothetical protein